MLPTLQIICNNNFLIPLNTSPHSHHSFWGFNYVNLKNVSEHNSQAKYFPQKSIIRKDPLLSNEGPMMLKIQTSLAEDACIQLKLRLNVRVSECVRSGARVDDEYVSAMSSDSPSRERDPQIEYTTGTETAYSQTMSIAQG